jgi:hypothetical protein
MTMIRIPSPGMPAGRHDRHVFEEAGVELPFCGWINATVAFRHLVRSDIHEEASDKSGARRARIFASAVMERHQ